MFRIFPFDRQEILIDKPKDELIKDLKRYVQLTNYIPIIKDERSLQFHGENSINNWKIILKSNDINSFRTNVYLTIKEEENKCRLIFDFKIHIAIRIVLIIFWIVAILFVVGAYFSNANKEVYLIPLGIILFSVIITYMGFFMSLEKTMNALEKVFKEIGVS